MKNGTISSFSICDFLGQHLNLWCRSSSMRFFVKCFLEIVCLFYCVERSNCLRCYSKYLKTNSSFVLPNWKKNVFFEKNDFFKCWNGCRWSDRSVRKRWWRSDSTNRLLSDVPIDYYIDPKFETPPAPNNIRWYIHTNESVVIHNINQQWSVWWKWWKCDR